MSISRPCGVVVSHQGSASERKPAPAFAIPSRTFKSPGLIGLVGQAALQAARHPDQGPRIARASAFLSVTAPDTFSEKVFSAPAAASEACCGSRDWPSVLHSRISDDHFPFLILNWNSAREKLRCFRPSLLVRCLKICTAAEETGQAPAFNIRLGVLDEFGSMGFK